MTHRFVVPSALVELLLAEHTTATLCSDRLGLQQRIDESPYSVCNAAGKILSKNLHDNLVNNVEGKLSDTSTAKLLHNPIPGGGGANGSTIDNRHRMRAGI